MTRLFSLILLLICLKGYGQNRLSDLPEIQPGSNYPSNMLQVAKWVNSSLSPFFISSLQHTDSQKGDKKFLSFSLMGKQSLNVALPNASGITLRFSNTLQAPKYKSQQIALEFQHEIRAYGNGFNPNEFHYTPESYYGLALEILRLTPHQIVANTLNYMVEPNKEGKSKFIQMVDDINIKMKTKIAYPTSNKVEELVSVLNKSFPDKINSVIFKTYIHVEKDPQKTNRNLNRFFVVTRFFSDGVINSIDRMINPTLLLGLPKAEALEFPAAILSPGGAKRHPTDTIRFEYQTIKAGFDYKNQKLELVFTGKLNQKAKINSGMLIQYHPTQSKVNLVKVPVKAKESVDFNELKLIIGEKSISLEGLTTDEYMFELLHNRWKN